MSRFDTIRDRNFLEVCPNKTVTLPKRTKVTKFVGDTLATFRCKNTFSNFGDRCKLPRPSGSTERCSIFGISRYSVFVFRPRGLRLWSPLALLGQKFAHVNQIIRNHAPPDPSFHPIHPSVTTPPQPMPSLENTDPPFASHSPTLCPPKPTLLLLLPSGLIPTLLIGNRHPLNP